MASNYLDNQTPPPDAEFVSVAIDLRRLRGRPIRVPKVDESVPKHIGLVALAHGDLEQTFECFYDACKSAAPDEKDKHSQRMGIKKRANHAKQKARRIFSDHHDIANVIADMCDEVKKLENQRNIVLHGHYKITIKNSIFVIQVLAFVEKKIKSVEFDNDMLESLWHDTLILAAMFHTFRVGKAFPPITPEKIQIAQDRLERHYHHPSSQPTPESLHLSSVR